MVEVIKRRREVSKKSKDKMSLILKKFHLKMLEQQPKLKQEKDQMHQQSQKNFINLSKLVMLDKFNQPLITL